MHYSQKQNNRLPSLDIPTAMHFFNLQNRHTGIQILTVSLW